MSRRVPARFSLAFTPSRGHSRELVPRILRGVLPILAGALPPLAVAAGALEPPGIGRLFSTPEQRAELDRMRADAERAGAMVPAATDASLEPSRELEEAPWVDAVTIDGIVLRDDGHGVAWVNGEKAAVGATTPEGVRVSALIARQGRVRVRIPGERGGSVDLEPGQTIVVESGRVLDAYHDVRTARHMAASSGRRANPVSDSEPSVSSTVQVVDHALE